MNPTMLLCLKATAFSLALTPVMCIGVWLLVRACTWPVVETPIAETEPEPERSYPVHIPRLTLVP